MASDLQDRRLALTVDVEWDHLVDHGTTGLERGLPAIVDILRDRGIPATFFILGEVCDLRPDLLEDLSRPGFEIGSHSYRHTSLHWKSRTWLRRSIRRSDLAIARTMSVRPRIFRAPKFSITGKALQILSEIGYKVDSSVLPNAEFRRISRLILVASHEGAPAQPYYPSRRNPAAEGSVPLVEIPLTENPYQPGMPISSGYLHSRGLNATIRALRHASSRDAIFLAHPWEHVNLEVGEGDVPRWLELSCNDDSRILGGLLDEVAEEWTIAPLSELSQSPS